MNNSASESSLVLDRRLNSSADESKLDAGSSISDPVMKIGRDEMNWAEFPLGGLASRTPKGMKSLVFEDRVWDKRQKAWVNKKLTVAASTEYGLPTAADDEVILGLLQLTHAGQFADRKLAFVPAELFRVLGWREEGRSYSRLEKSLKRWVGVTLYYDHAWWDKGLKTWMDEHFHLLDNVVIPRSRKKPTKFGDRRQRLPWTVTWNQTVFRSFEDGYLRKLDMTVFRKLRSVAAKRMFRFLDKRFYFTNRLTFDLRLFACERIGFNRRDDNSQLKRRLDRAIGELVNVGFLKPMPRTQRYRQIRRGEWEVAFTRKQEPKKARSRRSTSDCLESALVSRGVREPVAVELVRKHSPMAIRQSLKEYDELRKRGDDSKLKNPPGLLISWIKGSWGVPCDSSPPKAESTIPEPATSEGAESQSKLAAIRNYLAKLPPQERESLEADAMKAADGVRRAGYRRAESAGNSGLLVEYRNAIIESYVLRLLRNGAGRG
jgi:hypothetical protein